MSLKPKVALSQDFLLNLASLPVGDAQQGVEVGDPLPERSDVRWHQLREDQQGT